MSPPSAGSPSRSRGHSEAPSAEAGGRKGPQLAAGKRLVRAVRSGREPGSSRRDGDGKDGRRREPHGDPADAATGRSAEEECDGSKRGPHQRRDGPAGRAFGRGSGGPVAPGCPRGNRPKGAAQMAGEPPADLALPRRSAREG
jgi:hypothetical protein